MRNVAMKTLLRIRWYLWEAVPLFLVGTALLFALDRTGVLPCIVAAGRPLVTGLLGLPAEAAQVFIMGFLRRDYGAAGLFQLAHAGRLSATQAVVALTVMTLFVPCVANFLMMIKEQGLKPALAHSGVRDNGGAVNRCGASLCVSRLRCRVLSAGGAWRRSRSGERGVVLRVLRDNPARAERLNALGVTPGARRPPAPAVPGFRVRVRPDGTRDRAGRRARDSRRRKGDSTTRLRTAFLRSWLSDCVPTGFRQRCSGLGVDPRRTRRSLRSAPPGAAAATSAERSRRRGSQRPEVVAHAAAPPVSSTAMTRRSFASTSVPSGASATLPTRPSVTSGATAATTLLPGPVS